MRSNTYLYASGIRQIAVTLRGTETIHLGVRPFGFHAGNKLALLAYPLLLSEQMASLGKEPHFRFIVSINDWEPHELVYLDPDRFPYNVFPKQTSLQYTADPLGCCQSIVDHWQPIIEKQMAILSERFPRITIAFHRNSSLKRSPVFLQLLVYTLQNAKLIGRVIEEIGGYPIKEESAQFAGAICPNCKSARGSTSVLRTERIRFDCSDCSVMFEGTIESLDFWWYHVPLLIPRIIIFDVDLCIRGGDHFAWNRIEMNERLMAMMAPDQRVPDTLVTPLMLAGDGRKMSKSYGNTRDIALDRLMELADCSDQPTMGWPDDLV